MYRKALAGGVTAAAILGAGGTALALSGSDTAPTAKPAGPSATSAPGGHRPGQRMHGRARLLRRLAHAQVTVRGHGGFVTHDLIKGTVSAVSGSAITVKSGDGTSETFAITSATKFRVRQNGKGSAASISAVHNGDHVLVAGVGTGSYTAKHVVDIQKK